MTKHSFSCETAHCRVCLELFMTGDIFWVPNLIPKLPAYTEAKDEAVYLCQQCLKLHSRGYIALVEIDLEASDIHGDLTKIREEFVVRTGRRIHILRADAALVFKLPRLLGDDRVVAYVKEGIIDALTDHPNCRFKDEPDDDDN